MTNFRHGLNRHPVHIAWKNMKQRCYNKNKEDYADYGARGITVCERWIDDSAQFINDMYSTYKEGLSLDRIDNNLGYSKENCKWSTAREQANNRRNGRLIEYNGKKQSISEWARELGFKPATLYMRYYKFNGALQDAWRILL